ncbi:flagellar brake protein [Deefgea piscis]|uniref:flagellar brake protein n=1 Tax=Deefgea piscis TaxID=2739061 RepID=UPI001C82189F|nr:flagellar brake protein [Deefgea piscis]QZA79849.1 flagellar brake protein [Deefgea piscis]
MSDEVNGGIAPIGEQEDIAPYRITAIMEIAFVLRNLAQSNANLALYFNAGRDMMLSRVLSVDTKAQQFIIDVGGHEATNTAITQASKVLFVTALDNVKIQFSVGLVKRCQFEGKAAFTIQFPSDLIKLQRREFFRLLTPITNPLTCELSLPNSQKMQLELHDISLGGAGIWLKDEPKDDFPSGLILNQVNFDLASAGFAKVDIEIRSTHSVTMADGKVRWLLGVRFVDLPRPIENSLQRLLANLERERKALIG